ncbi:MAG TPA: carboxypeptidase-like regulatory domain-containing protein [Anaerolineales bacterium]
MLALVLLLVLLTACGSAGQPASAPIPSQVSPTPAAPTTAIPAATVLSPTAEETTSAPDATFAQQATLAPTNPAALQGTASTPQGTATGDSGIEGQALIGPACPGPARLEQPCPDKPYQGTFSVLDPASQQVARFQTGSDGKFRVPLPPGTYTLHAETTAAYPRTSDQAVTVRLGQFTHIDITFDSGIR